MVTEFQLQYTSIFYILFEILQGWRFFSLEKTSSSKISAVFKIEILRLFLIASAVFYKINKEDNDNSLLLNIIIYYNVVMFLTTLYVKNILLYVLTAGIFASILYYSLNKKAFEKFGTFDYINPASDYNGGMLMKYYENSPLNLEIPYHV